MVETTKTEYTAKIVWMGKVPLDRENIRSEAVQSDHATYAGFEGEYHAGLTRPACVRVRNLHAEGTEIRNVRQFSIISAEEMAHVADTLGLDEIDPLLLGASIVVEGVPDFTFVPPASRLQNGDGTTLVIDVENGPCQFPAREIEKESPGHGKAFKAAAKGRRGVCAWVEREGPLAVGDTLSLHIPNQRPWSP